MKRLFPILSVLLLICVSALADPLPLLEDYTGEIKEDYDGGTFLFSYRYPHVDENAEGGDAINAFISQELINYKLEFDVPIIQDVYESEGDSFSMVIDYLTTCNNDEYFSFLVKTDRMDPDQTLTYYEGYVFSRKNGGNGKTYTLPKFLGILESNENDTWLQDRQTGKADKLIRELVWEIIRENEEGIAYYDTFTEESLEAEFFPEENFYLDENGDPVFYLQPDIAAPASFGLLTFSIPLEDILDEL